MDIGAWLRGLGLDNMRVAFRDGEIEADVLSELTETDLEKLGLPLGHRKRILKAIKALGDVDQARDSRKSRYPRPRHGYSRASSIDGDVLRSGRLYRDLRST